MKRGWGRKTISPPAALWKKKNSSVFDDGKKNRKKKVAVGEEGNPGSTLWPVVHLL
jgi:hypothetical protein